MLESTRVLQHITHRGLVAWRVTVKMGMARQGSGMGIDMGMARICSLAFLRHRHYGIFGSAQVGLHQLQTANAKGKRFEPEQLRDYEDEEDDDKAVMLADGGYYKRRRYACDGDRWRRWAEKRPQTMTIGAEKKWQYD